MHPVMLDQLAQDHVCSLVCEAEAARLAREARAESARHGLRERVGLGMIALGERLAPQCPDNAVHLDGGRV